jgi:serine/threonine-protein kinase HipA
MLDMFQITEAFDKYKSSMEKIGKAIGDFLNNTLLDKLIFFEIIVFNFIIGNNDIHLKNFFRIEGNSGWVLSPAYDLLNVSIVNSDDLEELALTLNGKKSKLIRKHFDDFGISLGLTKKQVEGVYKRFEKKK